MASPTTPAENPENPMVKTKLRGLALLRTFSVTESSMSTKQRAYGPKTAWSNDKSAIFGLRTRQSLTEVFGPTWLARGEELRERHFQS
jgi:hypothetical protein